MIVAALGALIQGTVGFGFAFLAAPLLALLDPAWVPGPVIACGAVLTALLVVRERTLIDFSNVRWAIAGNAGGALAAALVLRWLAEDLFDLLFGMLVWLAVGLSLYHPRLVLTRSTTVLAGLASGFMGTATSIAAPPVLLLYQHLAGDRLRADLSAYFLASTIFALAALAAVGEFGRAEIERAAWLTPAVLGGYLVSYAGRRAVGSRSLRRLVLVISAGAATGLLGRAVVTHLG